MNMTHLIPAVHGRLSEHVLEQLREAILTGSFKPGERLREVDLASMLKVSATSWYLFEYRESLTE